MGKRYLITGGAGFIGSFLVEALLERGENVVAADNFSTGRRENLSAVENHPHLEIVEVDVIEQPEILESLIAGCDVIVHLAAAVGVDLVVNDPVRTITTNVKGSENVLAPAARYHKRILIASTSEVYGKSDRELFREDDDLHLGSPYRSRWSYACSKLLDEFYLMAFHQSAGLPGTIVRFFNTVGPRQTGRYGMVVPRFVSAALRNEPLQVFGDGGQSRCFCHVADVVRAVLLLLDDDRSIGRIFNIGSQELITIYDLAKRVIERCGSHSVIEKIPYEKAYAKGFEDMRRRRPDTGEIRKLTGWTPQYDLNRILDDIRRETEKNLQ